MEVDLSGEVISNTLNVMKQFNMYSQLALLQIMSVGPQQTISVTVLLGAVYETKTGLHTVIKAD